ncbi:class C sortase [Streptococcus porci]|uniref:class C sortase n=1 Tax=Streptococcus porci TaxID=502567 RepID=UPI000402E8F6|nr:class C sortase [Streptococcus porci]
MINKIKQNFITILLVFILLVGLAMLSYPTVSDYWNSFHQSKAVAGYVEKVANMDELDYQKILTEAQNYNDSLPQTVIPDLNIDKATEDTYNQTLDIDGSGIMAYVEIPKLNTIMPIYHGTDDSVLQVAIGHIPGTSLPVGGLGTHSVISGHRGLPSAKLFTDIDQLVEGDTFLIQVLDQNLTYEVDQILTVTPDDVSALEIDPQQDYVTLVTCTPYRVNSHRLLVRGHRIENEMKQARVTSEATQVKPILVAPFVGLILLMILFIVSKLYGHLIKG